MRVKQIYHHYFLWEDFRAGFYGYNFDDFDYKFNSSIELLSNPEAFFDCAKDMIGEWRYSCDQNLSDPSINKIAYIGQASCCYNHGAPAELTKKAWWHISKEKRDEADDVAREILKIWEHNKLMEGSLWGNDI